MINSNEQNEINNEENEIKNDNLNSKNIISDDSAAEPINKSFNINNNNNNKKKNYLFIIMNIILLISILIGFYLQINKFTEKIKIFEEEILNKNKEIINLIETNNKKDDEIKNQIIQNVKIKEIKDEVIKNIKLENNKLKEIIKNKEEEIKNKNLEITKLKENIKNKNEEIKNKNLENDKLTENIKNKEEEIKNKNIENDKLNENIKNKEEEIKNNNKNYEEKIQDLKDKLNDEKLIKPIIGIDFGSTFSGFSILFKKNGKEIEDKYIFTSEITLKKGTNDVVEIGKNSIKILEKNKNDFIYFENIKINLDPKKGKINPEKNELIESKFPINCTIKLKKVIKEYLKKISDIALKTLNNKSTVNKYTKNNIKWVVTVPAIWNEYAKQFMRECSKKAGMNDILISLEPEAASLTMFDDPSIPDNLKEKGTIFMLVDAGGYTVDITLNEIIDDFGNLKQLSPPSGGNFGSMNINLNLIKFIEEIYGKENIEKFKVENLEKWVNFKNEIEEKKISVCSYDSDNSDFKIENYFSNSIFFISNQTYETYYGKITYNKNYIYIPNSLIKNMIKKQLKKIINHIKNLFNNFNKTKIDQIVITGGFSNCELFKKKLTKHFKKTIISQLINPERSIAKGAALYGIKPNKIVSRISPFTFGVSGYEPQRKGFQCRNKKIINNNIECEYFIVFIKKGDEIKNNFTMVEYFTPLEEEQDTMSFTLFYSNSTNPVYIDENDVKEIANFYIESKETYLPRNERKVKIEMEFSSCITVRAKNEISGKEILISANYYNNNNEV